MRVTLTRVLALVVFLATAASVDAGNQAERLTIGMGAGASELKTAVEGYQVTAQGLRKLGSGTVDSGGSKSPGAAVGVAGLVASGTATEIAGVLQKRFQEQSWIQ